MSARYIIGDVFDVLATLEDDSVDLVFSSPPFLALRSYLPAEHPDKAKEIGSEATPADFLDTLLDVVEACSRVLAPHGSLCFELGDTFSWSGGAGGDYADEGLRDGQPLFDGSAKRARKGDGWPDPKSLCGIPQAFMLSLSHGWNVLRDPDDKRGPRRTPRWLVRNLVVWARPNPPVGALGDKFRPATSYLTVATKARDRYFDLDSVRSPTDRDDRGGLRQGTPHGTDERRALAGEAANMSGSNPAGAPPLDYWVIPTAPYKGSHYATFPPDLVVKPVKAMCPLRVCRVCGEPSRRIVEITTEQDTDRPRHNRADVAYGSIKGVAHNDHKTTVHETLGWSDCGCWCDQCWERGHSNLTPPCLHKWRTGLVLDPFAGSGTTLAVATGHGRDAVGIDLDERNADLALERVGPMFLTVEHLGAEPAA